ncbi:UdgX family uracil-DNA binding protein [Methyloligella solikamskensis]|uniref:Type-4 uracil-DNA glycosylase n=1 Tax=Methyloligella solikamskensis TaxID=1177756 RepID=A0ABW3JE61_9HYPH
MYLVSLPADLSADDAPFRDAVRRALSLNLSPEKVSFSANGQASLLGSLPDAKAEPLTVPPGYRELMQLAILHRAADRYDLLYEVLWRLKHGEAGLLSRASDPAVSRLQGYAKAVRRDIHKTHAFVRFAETQDNMGTLHVAFFEPKYFTLRRSAPFFRDRFAGMRWRIETPIGTASWDRETLRFGPAVDAPRKPQPVNEESGDLWKTYYRTTFNPARLRVDAMRAEMPKHYWRNLPEAAQIQDMIREAGAREQRMLESRPSAAPRFAERIAERRAFAEEAQPPLASLEAIKHSASACTRCPLHSGATQTVFGEGPKDAALMLVGEQPGDREDLAGRPFVGPAGQLLDRALKDAGIVREEAYVTNAVKHFKYEPRGKRRIHKSPNASEVSACRWWLDAEIAELRPRLIVALGGTAGLSLFGRQVSVTKERGQIFESGQARVLLTVHPSYLLRLPPEERTREYARFVADLTIAARVLSGPVEVAA